MPGDKKIQEKGSSKADGTPKIRSIRILLTPLVKAAFLVNSISAKIIAFILVKLFGRKQEPDKKIKKKI